MKRKEAHALKLQKYEADRSCKYGHPPTRYTSTGGCVECQRLAGGQFAKGSQLKSHEREMTFRAHWRDIATLARLLEALVATREAMPPVMVPAPGEPSLRLVALDPDPLRWTGAEEVLEQAERLFGPSP